MKGKVQFSLFVIKLYCCKKSLAQANRQIIKSFNH